MLVPNDRYIDEKIKKGDYVLAESELKAVGEIVSNVFDLIEDRLDNYADIKCLSKVSRLIILGVIEKAVSVTGSVDFMDEMLLRLEPEIKHMVDLIVSSNQVMMLCRMADGKPFTYYDFGENDDQKEW